jgi:hypothetical protein
MAHGKSFSDAYPLGARAMSGGKAKAPKSLRRRGKKYLRDCDAEEIAEAGIDALRYSPSDKDDRDILIAANML